MKLDLMISVLCVALLDMSILQCMLAQLWLCSPSWLTPVGSRHPPVPTLSFFTDGITGWDFMFLCFARRRGPESTDCVLKALVRKIALQPSVRFGLIPVKVVTLILLFFCWHNCKMLTVLTSVTSAT